MSSTGSGLKGVFTTYTPENLTAALPFASPRERDCIEAFLELGDIEAVRAKLGYGKVNSVNSHLSRALKKAARKGAAPDNGLTHSVVPEGYLMGKITTQYSETNGVERVWVRSSPDDRKQEQFLDLIRETLSEEIKPIPEIVAPTHTMSDLMAVYPIGDHHLGMFAWAKETGQDHDLPRGEAILRTAVKKLVQVAAPAEQALIVNVGDFYHSDNLDNQTRASGHVLDVDTRWPKVVRAGIWLLVDAVKMALEKHAKVKVINAIGNHDDHSAIFLSLGLELYFHNNPRVEIDITPSGFHWHRFGKNLFGVTHGHKVKHADLPAIMAHDRPEDWGATEFRHWYTGHLHHKIVQEYRGCTVETLRVLPPGDAWHHKSGYRSAREMKVDVWHKEFGLDHSHRVGIERINQILSGS